MLHIVQRIFIHTFNFLFKVISGKCNKNQLTTEVLNYKPRVAQWAETRKKSQFHMCVWVVAQLPQRLKINEFWKNFSSLQVPPSDSPLEFFSKSVDFSLWGKQCIFLPKWTFFLVLAHCALQRNQHRSSIVYDLFFLHFWDCYVSTHIFALAFRLLLNGSGYFITSLKR